MCAYVLKILTVSFKLLAYEVPEDGDQPEHVESG